MKDIDILGDYHLLLAHDICEQEAIYQEVFGGDIRADIILDNSSAELKAPVDFNMVSHAVLVVKPDFVILPDIINDASATLSMTEEAARGQIWPDLKRRQTNLRFMAVPQGKNFEQWCECVDMMLLMPNIDAFAVPKAMFWNIGSRLQCVEYLLRLTHKPIHLLGMSDDMEDDMYCARMPGVQGIDSAVPVWMGQRGDAVQELQKSHGKRGDFWTNYGTELTDTTIENLAKVRQWVK